MASIAASLPESCFRGRPDETDSLVAGPHRLPGPAESLECVDFEEDGGDPDDSFTAECVPGVMASAHCVLEPLHLYQERCLAAGGGHREGLDRPVRCVGGQDLVVGVDGLLPPPGLVQHHGPGERLLSTALGLDSLLCP